MGRRSRRTHLDEDVRRHRHAADRQVERAGSTTNSNVELRQLYVRGKIPVSRRLVHPVSLQVPRR
jgi:hypothetical protein